MKPTRFTTLLVIGLVLTFAAAGCRKRPEYMTRIPGRVERLPESPPPSRPLEPTPTTPMPPQSTPSAQPMPTLPAMQPPPVGMPQASPELREKWVRDREVFKNDTVHFDFDSSVVKTAEKPKVAAVADYLKVHAQDALEIEGHCDERGTEEYNRSLGERRALALREELIRLGIDPLLIDTTTYGKDRPVALGHDEAAWKQNRRGEFLLEVHPK